MNDDELYLESARRLFSDVADIQSVVSARDDGWKQRLWSGIEETGLNLAASPEHLGGVDIGLQACLGILRVAGNMAVSAPLAETMLAGWLLGAAGLPLPPGKVAFGPSSFHDRITLRDGLVDAHVPRLPFARECGHAALLADGPDGLSVVLVSLEGAGIDQKTNLAFDAVDRLTLVSHPALAVGAAPPGFRADTTLLMGSAARAMQVAGALEKILAITVEYVQQRRAFERTISRFQAVQHSVAQLAGETAASLSSAASAAEALHNLVGGPLGFDDPDLRLEIIAAKIRTASAARKGVAIAHQMLGAIGVTREHVLHRLTLRALAWRDDYGNDGEWSARLGQLVCGAGAPSLWPLLARR